MKLLKWTIIAAVGCLPVLSFAEEPAKKPEKPAQAPQLGEKPREGIRIEVKGDDGKPQVIVIGEGEGKESKEAAHEVKERVKLLEQLIKKAQQEKKPQQDVIILREAREGREGREGEIRQFDLTIPLNIRHHELKKGGYLGISTDAPPPVLSKHLGLHDGFGLVVDQVMHESPAAKAGLKKFDVIEKVDDQLVINMEQLSVLIHSHKAGDEVKLGIIHEGKPAVLTAKLAEHEYEPLGEARENEELEGVIRHLLPQQGRAWQMVPGGQGGLAPGQAMPGAQINRAQLAPRAGGGAIGQPRPTSKTLIEGDRTYTLTVSPWGQKVFVVTEKGKELFEGAVNNPEQREKVPANMMDMLKKLEKEVMPQIIKTLPPGASLPLNPAPKAAQNPAQNPAQSPAQNPAPKKKADKDSDAK